MRSHVNIFDSIVLGFAADFARQAQRGIHGTMNFRSARRHICFGSITAEATTRRQRLLFRNARPKHAPPWT